MAADEAVMEAGGWEGVLQELQLQLWPRSNPTEPQVGRIVFALKADGVASPRLLDHPCLQRRHKNKISRNDFIPKMIKPKHGC